MGKEKLAKGVAQGGKKAYQWLKGLTKGGKKATKTAAKGGRKVGKAAGKVGKIAGKGAGIAGAIMGAGSLIKDLLSSGKDEEKELLNDSSGRLPEIEDKEVDAGYDSIASDLDASDADLELDKNKSNIDLLNAKRKQKASQSAESDYDKAESKVSNALETLKKSGVAVDNINTYLAEPTEVKEHQESLPSGISQEVKSGGLGVKGLQALFGKIDRVSDSVAQLSQLMFKAQDIQIKQNNQKIKQLAALIDINRASGQILGASADADLTEKHLNVQKDAMDADAARRENMATKRAYAEATNANADARQSNNKSKSSANRASGAGGKAKEYSKKAIDKLSGGKTFGKLALATLGIAAGYNAITDLWDKVTGSDGEGEAQGGDEGPDLIERGFDKLSGMGDALYKGSLIAGMVDGAKAAVNIYKGTGAAAEATEAVTKDIAKAEASEIAKATKPTSKKATKKAANKAANLAQKKAATAAEKAAAKKLAEEIGKEASEAAAKKAAGKLSKEAEMKLATKLASKFGSKVMAKVIPGAGALLSYKFAKDMWEEGDYVGAVIEGMSGVASLVPGAGAVVSGALDGLQLLRKSNPSVYGGEKGLEHRAGYWHAKGEKASKQLAELESMRATPDRIAAAKKGSNSDANSLAAADKTKKLTPKDKSAKVKNATVNPKDFEKSVKNDKFDIAAAVDVAGFLPNYDLATGDDSNVIKDPMEPSLRGICARYVRAALEAGGINTQNRPGEAYEYAKWLPNNGFRIIDNNSKLLPGDISVEGKTDFNPHGHIAIWDGTQWISDRYQNGRLVTPPGKHGKLTLLRHHSMQTTAISKNTDYGKDDIEYGSDNNTAATVAELGADFSRMPRGVQDKIANAPQNKKDYIDRIRPLLLKVLESKNYVPKDAVQEYADMLTAQTSLETGWGKSSLNYKYNNYSGMTYGTAKHPAGKVTMTNSAGGDRNTYAVFDSIEHWADEYVEYLNRKWHAFDGPVGEYFNRLQHNKSGQSYATDPDYVKKNLAQTRSVRALTTDVGASPGEYLLASTSTNASGQSSFVRSLVNKGTVSPAISRPQASYGATTNPLPGFSVFRGSTPNTNNATAQTTPSSRAQSNPNPTVYSPRTINKGGNTTINNHTEIHNHYHSDSAAQAELS